ncbi:hypothetical protein [Propionivibrio sp.]|uniref:hypothetical protein n=1 Tax=Propionivibrio sp. TaxID=2212460 RepID=UPI003BEF564E
MQPQTINEVSNRIAMDVTNGKDIWGSMPYHVNDFRHWLLSLISEAGKDADSVVSMAVKDAPVKTGTPVTDVYLAGLAEYLSQNHNLVVPSWANDPQNFLKEPYYTGSKRLQDLLTATTPSAWRRRLLFCGESSF